MMPYDKAEFIAGNIRVNMWVVRGQECGVRELMAQVCLGMVRLEKKL